MTVGKPKVTVLMPVYNGEKYLRPAIESILAQEFTNFEFLIINDGSVDSSVDIIQSYKDSRIKLIHNEKNIKLVATLNKGLSLATGEYIARMDCDDISLPSRLEKQVNFMDNHPEIGLCSTNISIIKNNEVDLSPFWSELTVPIEWDLLWRNAIAHPTVMIRKRVLDDNNLKYSPVYAEDLDLWLKLAFKTRFVRINEVLLYYRVVENSAFNAQREKHLVQSIKSTKQYAGNITGQSVPELHDKFTLYYYGLGKNRELINFDNAIDWFSVLLKSSRAMWKWERNQYESAVIDAQLKLFDYLKGFPSKYGIKEFIKVLILNNNRNFTKLHYQYLVEFLRTSPNTKNIRYLFSPLKLLRKIYKKIVRC